MAVPNTPLATRVVAVANGTWTLVDTGMTNRVQVEVQNQSDDAILVALGGIVAPTDPGGWKLDGAAEWVRLFGGSVRIWAKASTDGVDVAVNEIGA